MNKLAEHVFTTRPTIVLELPLDKKTRILHPEQVILKIREKYYDIGSFCYAMRSDNRRKPGQPCEVVLSSFIKQRPKHILQLIKALSRFTTDGGKRIVTVQNYAGYIGVFINWADENGLHDYLSGGDASRKAYLAWVEDALERYRRQEIGGITYNKRISYIREILEATTDLEDLRRCARAVKVHLNPNGATDPLAPHDFSHAVALNHALFEGLCDLILEQRPFPYKLVLPATLGWEENHLWLFPSALWCLPPHEWGAVREKRTKSCWAYDYSAGCLASAAEIAHRYAMWRYPSDRIKVAKKVIQRAQDRIKAANALQRDWVRLMLGMIAHNAFLFLFFCHTGANESTTAEIETDSTIDADTLNQQFRSIKFRANSKPITLTVPATFMPSLRRFMELRRYLLGNRTFPYLFFTLGVSNKKPPRQIGVSPLESLINNVLRAIDPQIPVMGSRKLRASVADWYQRHHDASITAKVLLNLETTAQKHYDAGSANDHHEELSLFLNSVSESAKRQRVVPIKVASDTRPLEEGGCCDSFGHPEALADHVPIQPNCQDSQGCLFCTHRVLVACEDDARKVASAAFVMEQVILGPKHEEALRPLIAKCDEDLEKIAAFNNCRAMVEQVRKDVFQNGNLTLYFADKFQLFLELGVIT